MLLKSVVGCYLYCILGISIGLSTPMTDRPWLGVSSLSERLRSVWGTGIESIWGSHVAHKRIRQYDHHHQLYSKSTTQILPGTSLCGKVRRQHNVMQSYRIRQAQHTEVWGGRRQGKSIRNRVYEILVVAFGIINTWYRLVKSRTAVLKRDTSHWTKQSPISSKSRVGADCSFEIYKLCGHKLRHTDTSSLCSEESRQCNDMLPYWIRQATTGTTYWSLMW